MGVVDYNIRYETCGKVIAVIDFCLSLLNTTVVWGYLAIFDFNLSPNLRITIIVFILLRILLCILASLAIYSGMRKELGKTLVHLGTDIKTVKTVRQMVDNIDHGDLQLQVMG